MIRFAGCFWIPRTDFRAIHSELNASWGIILERAPLAAQSLTSGLPVTRHWVRLVNCAALLASAFLRTEAIEIMGFGGFHRRHYRGMSAMRRSRSAKRASGRSVSNCGSMASSVICVSRSANALSRFSKALAFSPKWA